MLRAPAVARNDFYRAKTDSVAGERHAAAVGQAGVAAVQRLLHVDDVDPAAVLEADAAADPGLLEAEGSVQADGARVFAVADHRHQLADAESLAGGDDSGENRAPDAFALGVGRDIDAVLQGVAVGDR